MDPYEYVNFQKTFQPGWRSGPEISLKLVFYDYLLWFEPVRTYLNDVWKKLYTQTRVHISIFFYSLES